MTHDCLKLFSSRVQVCAVVQYTWSSYWFYHHANYGRNTCYTMSVVPGTCNGQDLYSSGTFCPRLQYAIYVIVLPWKGSYVMTLSNHTSVKKACGLYITMYIRWLPTHQFKIKSGIFGLTRSSLITHPLNCSWMSTSKPHLSVTQVWTEPWISQFLGFNAWFGYL